MDALRPLARLRYSTRCAPSLRLISTLRDDYKILCRQLQNLRIYNALPSTVQHISTSRTRCQENQLSTGQTIYPSEVNLPASSSQGTSSPDWAKRFQFGHKEDASTNVPPKPAAPANAADIPQATKRPQSWGLFSIAQRSKDRQTKSLDVKEATRELFPNTDDASRYISQEVSRRARQLTDQRVRNREEEVLLRLKPSLGRTRMVGAGADLQASIAFLEASCRRNDVRFMERKQAIYVRRGQRRKELRSQRWRKMFKEGFVKEVSRIQKMRRQGW